MHCSISLWRMQSPAHEAGRPAGIKVRLPQKQLAPFDQAMVASHSRPDFDTELRLALVSSMLKRKSAAGWFQEKQNRSSLMLSNALFDG